MDRALPVGDGLTRRGLLVLGAGAAGTALTMQLSGGAARAPRAAVLDHMAFAPHVGAPFQLRTSAGARHRVRLDRIEEHHPGEAFVLTFHAPPHVPRLEQDVMRVTTPGAQAFDLLVSPSGTGRAGQDYAVVVDTRLQL